MGLEAWSPGSPAVKSAVVVVAAGMLAVAVGASLGFLPGYYAAAVRDDLGISRAQVGLLVSLHFGCTGVGALLAARVTERIGARNAVVADQLIVAAAAWVSATIGSYAALLTAAAFAGFGYALTTVATNAALAVSVPEHRRTLALSARTSGVPLMALVGAALVPWASNRWSWNATVMVVAVIAAVSALVSAAVIPNARSARTRSSSRSRATRGAWWFSASTFFLVGSSQPMYSWAVPYLDEGLGTSKPVAGAIAAIASGTGALGMVLNGLRADRVGRAGRVSLIVGLSAAMAVFNLVILGGLTLGLAVAAVGLVLGIVAQLAAVGTMHAALVDRFPSHVARATGITMTGYYLGALASPVAFGALVDWLDTYTWAWLTMFFGSVAAVLCFARANRVGER